MFCSCIVREPTTIANTCDQGSSLQAAGAEGPRRELPLEPHSCWNRCQNRRPDNSCLPADHSKNSGPRAQWQDLHAGACTGSHSCSGCGSEVSGQLIFQHSAAGGVCCGAPSRAWRVSLRAPDRDRQGDPGACHHRNKSSTAAGIRAFSRLGCCAAAARMQASWQDCLPPAKLRCCFSCVVPT